MDEFNALRRGEGWAGVKVWPDLLSPVILDENDRGWAPTFGVACCISTAQGELVLAPGFSRSLESMTCD